MLMRTILSETPYMAAFQVFLSRFIPKAMNIVGLKMEKPQGRPEQPLLFPNQALVGVVYFRGSGRTVGVWEMKW